MTKHICLQGKVLAFLAVSYLRTLLTEAFFLATPVISKQRATTTSNHATSEDVDICVIGGGVSGLTAALTAATSTSQKVVVLESQDQLGGRVQTDLTDSGFLLDRGFAVFIEEYPCSQQLLDYDKLQLGQFLPGALVKIDSSSELQRVADPFRRPLDLYAGLRARVGTFVDKLRVLPLLYHVSTRSVEQLFDEDQCETDTLSTLTQRWGFSDDMITKFYAPFLEGIYLAPLSEQSSRMFAFVLKMFAQGAASLPARGIGAVAQQLAEKARMADVQMNTGQTVIRLERQKNSDSLYIIQTAQGRTLRASSVIVATDGPVARQLLATVDDDIREQIENAGNQEQRFVGCLYYSFPGPEPVRDPILILNGSVLRGSVENPINNVCFPSVVSPNYAPDGTGLCSVTVLKDAMDMYQNRDNDLDQAVRNQLATWFPQQRSAILGDSWKLERIYRIPKAQPAQLLGSFPANCHGGRPSDTYLGASLPQGLYVCGDYTSTATLNGALESGIRAGKAAKAYARGRITAAIAS